MPQRPRPIAALLPRPLPAYGNLDAYGNWGDLAGDERWRRITPRVPPAQRPGASAALGVIAFARPQGPGWYKGGHDDSTANTLVCVERGLRCVLILSNDVRAERRFPALVRVAAGETGVPYRWKYPGLAAY